MGQLYRGVCDALDRANEGRLQPKGRLSAVSMTRGDSKLLITQGGNGIPRDGSITRYPSDENAVRSQHIQSGLNDNCFLSFTRSREKALWYATRTIDGERTNGFIYVVDETLLAVHGVTQREVNNAYFPDEMEVSLRATDCGDLPPGIVVKKIPCTPED
ncbi:hypothetical protein [Cupriavidus malaysiensis]|uniref:hypothetical protein n=1 Tax=Cupriavidus malaysiensis TaxID=367825 RepID=UPI003AAF44D5